MCVTYCTIDWYSSSRSPFNSSVSLVSSICAPSRVAGMYPYSAATMLDRRRASEETRRCAPSQRTVGARCRVDDGRGCRSGGGRRRVGVGAEAGEQLGQRRPLTIAEAGAQLLVERDDCSEKGAEELLAGRRERHRL